MFIKVFFSLSINYNEATIMSNLSLFRGYVHHVQFTSTTKHLYKIKGTVSRAVSGFWWHKWIDIGLDKRRVWFLFFRCPSEITELFTCFFRLMQVCVIWLFLSFLYNCALMKVDWLAAFIALRVVGALLVVSKWEARADTWRNVANPADQ
jgi:hypothetical protein